MAARTRSRVCSLTLGWSFSTLETVWCETPASLATSVMAGPRDPLMSTAAPRLECRFPGETNEGRSRDPTPLMLAITVGRVKIPLLINSAGVVGSS